MNREPETYRTTASLLTYRYNGSPRKKRQRERGRKIFKEYMLIIPTIG